MWKMFALPAATAFTGPTSELGSKGKVFHGKEKETKKSHCKVHTHAITPTAVVGERLGRGSSSCWSDLDLGALLFPEPVPALMGFTLQVVKIQLNK